MKIKKIIDTSDNMLSLRMACSDMNNKIGGKCEVVSHNDYIKLPLNRIYEGIQLDEVNESIREQMDLRFVCEGCSVVVNNECDLDYIMDDADTEYQYCSDCAEIYS